MADHEGAEVAEVALELHVDLPVARFDGVHHLPKVLRLPDIRAKGRADRDYLVPGLRAQARVRVRLRGMTCTNLFGAPASMPHDAVLHPVWLPGCTRKQGCT